MKHFLINLFCAAMLFSCSKSDEITEGIFVDARDGKEYPWVKYGDQVWMTKNLAYKADSNCVIYMDRVELLETYGYLYTNEMAQLSCPEGWHIPNNEEWAELFDYFGGDSIAGGKMKSYQHWHEPNTGAEKTNTFNILPGGYKYRDGGEYSQLSFVVYYWSATPYKSLYHYTQQFSFDKEKVYTGYNRSEHAMCARLIKDN